MNVLEPASTGIGGDCFCLFYRAKDKKVLGLNGSGRTPAALTLDFATKVKGFKGSIPNDDINAVTVPGAAAGWVDTVEHLGSGRLTLGEILAPAIEIAESGFLVEPISSQMWQEAEEKIRTASPNFDEILLNGKAPRPGEFIRLPELAQTLAQKGKAGFYKGCIARAIVDLIQSKGGVMTLDDLKEHESTFVEPITFTYQEKVNVFECPPNGQGITALMALGIIEALQEEGVVKDLGTIEHNSAEYLHVVIEALRIAFADTRWFVADPSVVNVPVQNLLDKAYLKERAKLFDPKKATISPLHGSPVNSSDTV
ncbi:hypothetical protein HK102_010928 [Quaeritorhiza haematococci]|nr:hypothetical protein HK102_010928 [Quaeritorhiza haematococci]